MLSPCHSRIHPQASSQARVPTNAYYCAELGTAADEPPDEFYAFSGLRERTALPARQISKLRISSISFSNACL